MKRFRSYWSPISARLLAAFGAVALLALPAGAVIIDSGDGTGNTTAPPEGPGELGDPGWDYVGTMGGVTAVYLRNGWVLTANHVAIGTVVFGGVSYDPLLGSEIRLDNGDGTFADLKLFGITPEPGLPELPIRASTNLPNGTVILIGNGRDRGAATDSDDPTVWIPPPNPPFPPIQGYLWAGSRSLRWGTNVVEDFWPGDPLDTVAFYTVFDAPGPGYTADEAQGANGDSGGALFAKQGSTWELAGILYVIGLWEGQVNNSALYGNRTGAADLSFYRDDIMDITAVPEPGGSLLLGAGIAFLATVGRRRMRP
jgi:hypothetical protein